MMDAAGKMTRAPAASVYARVSVLYTTLSRVRDVQAAHS